MVSPPFLAGMGKLLNISIMIIYELMNRVELLIFDDIQTQSLHVNGLNAAHQTVHTASIRIFI